MRILDKLAQWIESARPLDAPANQLSALTAKTGLTTGVAKKVLSGELLGHPLHPLLVTVPIGSWVAATYFDLTGKNDDAAEKLVGLGVLSAFPTMAAGLHDYASTHGPEQRVGFAHAVGNTVALSLYAGSYLARRRGHHLTGAALAVAGASALGASGWLGGHLSYALGVGVDTTAFLGGNDEWQRVASKEDVAGGAVIARELDGVSVLLTTMDGNVVAMANRCTHRGAPLSDGERKGNCIVCPWHSSAFSLRDGAVEDGPASRPQPLYDVRVDGNDVYVKRHRMSNLQATSA